MNLSTIHIGDLLQLIFPSENVRLLSGVNDAACLIEWVCLDAENGQKGDLLLIPSDKIFEDTFRLAKEREISAILIIGQSVEIVKERAKFPVFLVKTDKDIRQIHREITSILHDHGFDETDRKFEIHAKLTKLAADGVELIGLAQAMFEITHHGILIQDKRLKTMAEVIPLELQSDWEGIKDQLRHLNNLPFQLHDRQLAGEHNIVLSQALSDGISRVVVPIVVSSVARGFLSIIGKEGNLNILDDLVAEEGALICAIDMSRSKAVRETEKKLQSDLLTALLQEDLSPRDAKLWIDAVGLDRSQAHCAVQFSWDSPSPPSKRRLETLINGEIAKSEMNVILYPTNEAIICFCEISHNEKAFHSVLDFGAKILSEADAEFPNSPLRCGIGSPAADLSKWHITFREAGLALDMAARLKQKKPLYFPDLSVYRLLLLLENTNELEAFQKDTLGELLIHENRNEFIRTLEAYFEQSGNLSRTADALFIHRNTLTYRLKHISEITDLDLNNGDTALAVQLALKIYRMIQDRGVNL